MTLNYRVRGSAAQDSHGAAMSSLGKQPAVDPDDDVDDLDGERNIDSWTRGPQYHHRRPG